jgi:aerobic-type carbon monoxide dehydrogenase small subunit (CoxS/CutS family)
MTIRLEVNGAPREVDAAPDTPLLYVLRNELDLAGTKYGCGAGYCGACMVLVEGEAKPSCDVRLEDVAGKRVTTIEGLGAPKLVEAFVHEQAAQCGYCTAGIVVSAAALLRATPAPSDAQIRAALANNLCRCGSQPRVLRAVKRAAGAT